MMDPIRNRKNREAGSRRGMVAVVVLLASIFATSVSARTVVGINRGWKFVKQDVSGAQATTFNDGAWTAVNLPHSFDMPYWRANNPVAPYVGWYRKTLAIDPSVVANKQRVFIEFKAAFLVSTVYVNGTLVGTHKGGYTGFSYDITNQVKAGNNSVAVRVDANWNDTVAPRSGEHIFIGGIYRDVDLVVTDPVHVPWYGTAVTAPLASAASATVKVATEIKNDATTDAECTVKSIVLDSTGKQIASFEAKGVVKAGDLDTLTQTSAPIASPKLWSPSTPTMYKVRTEVYNGAALVDQYESPLGFRSLEWTKDQGLLVNGAKLWLQGTNAHQDHAGWGDATANTGSLRDVRLIKETGMNFIRGSHYPHSPAFSEACDKLGVLLWEESPFWACMMNASGWLSGAYPTNAGVRAPFEQNVLMQLGEMIRIHRNHPSVAVWSMGNEDFFTNDMSRTYDLLKKMIETTHKLDPSRAAGTGGLQRGNFAELVDVAGYNGDGAYMFMDPGRANMVSEYGSCQGARPGTYDACWGQDLQLKDDRPIQQAWRAGVALWCAFHHGSDLGMGDMGMMDHARLPLRRWYYYRHIYTGAADPVWPVDGNPANLKLTTDADTITDDGRTDCHLKVQVQNSAGAWLSNSPDITLTDKSGLGMFPTGTSITFKGGDKEKGVLDGMAAIEFRSYRPGLVTIEASSMGMAASTVTIYVKHVPDSLVVNSTSIAPRVRSLGSQGLFKVVGSRITVPEAWRGRSGVVHVYDLRGEQVRRISSDALPEAIEQGMPSGMYLVKIESAGP